ncbi:inorganic phosphate transporter [Oryzicola mucosus]|uniref:Phosphate transporter n=1 Tax=Oryzicola mucosus TaxID=2767425 RepID=A0A8J6PJN0_9HYPH|nr:inorganic phosphate transporter [Oryzicola mucosus]MBD0416194.1 inorganic phosphate transporter [Oryzicola mucosus]
MADRKSRKTTLDKDLEKFSDVEEASIFVARSLVAPGIALLFLALAVVYAALTVSGAPGAVVIVAAAAIGGYMALNIGANDVANNVGPAVGAKAITMGSALIMAAIFESAGALIAGWNVVATISAGIIPPALIDEPALLVHMMMAALISASLWVHFSTWIGAPVSTTHSLVGAVLGAGLAAAGIGAVDWLTIGTIAFGWAASPLIGGAMAALFLAFIESSIVYQDDKIAAARRNVPLLIALMAGSFAAYLTLLGMNFAGDGASLVSVAVGAATFVLAWIVAHRLVKMQSIGLENRNQSLKVLFRIPLVAAAALLSFAHGANDVSNAVGPLAAIVHALVERNIQTDTLNIPVWVMVIGAMGISVGLLLYGPRLIRMVGEQITRLNPMRAFSVALATAFTVLVASWLGLPVSTTHIAVGGVFGVGFFREWYTANSQQRRNYIERKRLRENAVDGEDEDAPKPRKQKSGKANSQQEVIRRRLVRRAHVRTIVAAWFATVPAAALFSALVFWASSVLL